MTVTNVRKDLGSLTMTLTAEFDAPMDRVWQLWKDPRRLERWWGPPTYPATMVDHDLTPGGTVSYYMTGPAGDKHHGWWRVHTVDPPRLLGFEYGFADDGGTPNPAMPTTNALVTLSELPAGGTRMAIETKFPTVEAMEQVLSMGAEEGMASALAQIDEVLESEEP